MSMKRFLHYLPSLWCIAAFNFANLMQIVFTIQAHLENGFTYAKNDNSSWFPFTMTSFSIYSSLTQLPSYHLQRTLFPTPPTFSHVPISKTDHALFFTKVFHFLHITFSFNFSLQELLRTSAIAVIVRTVNGSLTSRFFSSVWPRAVFSCKNIF